MLISFNNKKIRAICEEEEIAFEEFSEQVVVKLQDRLADIAAANNVLDIIIGNPIEIKIDNISCYKVDLTSNYILTFTANNTNIPKLENGNVDWSKVNRVKILEIKEQNG